MVALVFALHAQAWAFLCDDAFISFRYAENLGQHGALVFNVGVEPPEFVEGYTNFAWVCLLGIGSAVGVRPHLLAPTLTVIASAAGLVLCVALFRALDVRSTRLNVVHLSPAMLLVAMPEYMVWSGSGLETAAATALVLGSMFAWSRQRWVLAASLAALAGLTRPDALLPIAVFGLAWLLVQGIPSLSREGMSIFNTVPWRRLGLATAVFVMPLVAHLLWRHAYYGAWLPNTWPIKAHGMLLRDTYGQAYVEAWTDNVHLLWFAPLLLGVRPRHVVVLAPIIAVVGYGWWVGGDFMAYSRFYLLATALLAIAIAWILADAMRWVAARLSKPRIRHLSLGVIAVLAGLYGREARVRHALDVERGGRWIDGRWEGVVAMDQFAKVGFAAGSWMHDNLPSSTLITVGAAGAVPYGARLPTVDAYGLVDPVIATLPEAGPYKGKGARPGHQLQAPVKYIRQRDPDLLCHVGYRGAKPPSSRRRPRGYGNGYTWACIDLPAIDDAHAPQGVLPQGVYCCRRPRDRVVGPFGAGGGA